MAESDTWGQVIPLYNTDVPHAPLAQPSDQRPRLLQRLLTAHVDAVSDGELLELILFSMPAPIHANVLAIRLLERFGTLDKVIRADALELRTVDGVNDAVLYAFITMRFTAQRMAKSTIAGQPIINASSALMEYCKLAMGHQTVEEFRVLFLNAAHVLIADEVMQRGTVNHTPVYPREIVKRALELSASAMILVHNHTSGDPTPSKADRDVTAKIVAAAALFNITVHDHVIITDNGHYSFKSFELL